ncbi:ABC transporter ATP-binding protein [Desulforhopalus sp. IMCC35007]|uniref:ABC transporter ATP-binding protein n=1 Tax=Desulforhopalus sp. IMCC35007 TaxID=2569543 RepID=UPI0010AE2B42|nr:ATP-binding cassette domain-containing protein [Desulforhopalus sp. IMCC35007]TKB05822.1 ATP-binding cassette domain-containing protein [Desulforhopalus sp. IMCC35007]
MIRISNLSRHYNGFKAVDDVSFHIQKGEVVGLLGHNGAGKTTIMKMITGFLEPTSGSIEVDGLCIGADTIKIQEKIGYLPENCPVWPEMVVLDYLQYQASLHGIPEDLQKEAIARAVRRTALQQKATATIQTLSRGYRQRVGVAQAILHDPAILVLDEPTNGLDPTQILQMRSLIRDLAKNATIIVSTHILQEVQAVCDRVLIMRSGKMVVDSKLKDLQSNQRILLCVNNEKADTYLSKIKEVRHLESLGVQNGHYHFSLVAVPESAPIIAEAVQQAGDRLYTLQPEVKTLEKLFTEVNSISADQREVVNG